MTQFSSNWFRALLSEDLVEIMKLQQEHLADQYMEFPQGDGIMYSAFFGKAKSLQLLLTLTRQQTTEKQYGMCNGISALMYACMSNNPQCVQLLLFQQGNRSTKGVTAMMTCAIYNSYQCAEMLIESETGFTTLQPIFDLPENQSALQLALKFNSRQCIELLISYELLINFDEVILQLNEKKIIQEQGFNQGYQIKMGLDTILSINQQFMQLIKPKKENSQQLNTTYAQSLTDSIQCNNVANSYNTPSKFLQSTSITSQHQKNLLQNKINITEQSPTRQINKLADSQLQVLQLNDINSVAIEDKNQQQLTINNLEINQKLTTDANIDELEQIKEVQNNQWMQKKNVHHKSQQKKTIEAIQRKQQRKKDKK